MPPPHSGAAASASAAAAAGAGGGGDGVSSSPAVSSNGVAATFPPSETTFLTSSSADVNSNSNSNPNSNSNSNGDAGTQRYRSWLNSVRTHLIERHRGYANDPVILLSIAAIDDDLDQFDRKGRDLQKIETARAKNEESTDNGVKSLIASVVSTAIAVVSVVYNRNESGIATLVGTLAPIGTSIYVLTKSRRRATDEDMTGLLKEQREVRHRAISKIWGLANELAKLLPGPKTGASDFHQKLSQEFHVADQGEEGRQTIRMQSSSSAAHSYGSLDDRK